VVTDCDISALVRTEPAGIEIDVRPGESVIEAAWCAEYTWPILCFGMGHYAACQCEVLGGLHLLSEWIEAEIHMLCDLNRCVRRANPRRVRLACQLKFTGDVTVRKPGVKKKTNLRPEPSGSDGGSRRRAYHGG
jgi:ferredoxin, 2Fe-2S